MNQRVIALYHNPWPGAPLARPGRASPFALYRYAVWYKANPRDAAYMRELQRVHYPAAEWVDTGVDGDWVSRVAKADTLVLVYPDATGLGFSAVERIVLKNKLPWAGVRVLNGRGRDFLLNSTTRMGLRLRRFLSWSMFGELLFLPVFIVATPLLWAVDLMRGRT